MYTINQPFVSGDEGCVYTRRDATEERKEGRKEGDVRHARSTMALARIIGHLLTLFHLFFKYFRVGIFPRYVIKHHFSLFRPLYTRVPE